MITRPSHFGEVLSHQGRLLPIKAGDGFFISPNERRSDTKGPGSARLDAFETGNVPEALARTMLPRIDVPCNRWSHSNRLLAYLSGMQDARGIQQWREVGRWLNKGSKAVLILVPLYAQRKKSARIEDQEKPRFLVGFGCCPVFRVEDTEGALVETLELAPPAPPPLIDVAKAWQIEVRLNKAWGIIASGAVERTGPDAWQVRSSSGSGYYLVTQTEDGTLWCSCPDFAGRNGDGDIRACKIWLKSLLMHS